MSLHMSFRRWSRGARDDAHKETIGRVAPAAMIFHMDSVLLERGKSKRLVKIEA